MKKIFLLALLFITSFTVMTAQNEELPLDPKVKYGKLENGLTYYIRHNELPKDRVEIHMAADVGAVLEDDDQNGLAHFLEHMCFNGTKHFPGNAIDDYLESIGVREVNAGTSIDKTVYYLSNVPTTRESLIDSCLLIIRDWAGDVSLDDIEIEKERGVIREELRLYGSADWRLDDKLRPQIMPGNRYSERNVIGTEEVIMNFKPQTLRNFYHKWYRPDLQAVIIVGDIDVDVMEKKIVTLFSDLKMPENAAPVPVFPVADNEEPLVGIATDKEATIPMIEISYKHEAMPKEMKGTVTYVMTQYLDNIASRIMSERFRDILQQANPPFLNGGAYNSFFANTRTAEAWQGWVFIKDNNVEDGFKTLLREMERVNRHGFTAGEYERAKSNLLTQYETQYNERDKTMNGNYANECTGHFIYGIYMPGIEMFYNIINMIAPNIPVEILNEYIMEMMNDDNRNLIIAYQGPEAKDGVPVPTKEQLLAWLKEVQAETIEPLAETLSDVPLMTELPKGGKIVKEEKHKLFDATLLTLSNGVKVMIKSTNLKDDEILMAATSPGGTSHFPDQGSINARLYDNFANVGGLGNFSNTELAKALAGKKVSVSPTIDLTSEGFSGNSNVKDFETMLQLIYLNFTAPRMDEDASKSMVTRLKSQLEAMDADPDMEFQYKLPEVMYKDPSHNAFPRAYEMDNVNYQTIMDFRKDRYADASDFTFTFVGNINVEEAKEMIALYLGSLPSINRNESFVPVNVDYYSGINDHLISKKMDNPKATVFNLLWTMLDNSQMNEVTIGYLNQVLDIVLAEKIREEESGVYYIQVYGDISEYPSGRTDLLVVFETDPEKASYLNKRALEEIQHIADNGPKEADYLKAKEFLLKKYADNLQQNGYWRNIMNTYNKYGKDNHTRYLDIANQVTPADIQAIAKKIISAGNKIEFILTGTKE